MLLPVRVSRFKKQSVMEVILMAAKVVVIATGGTIAMRFDAAKNGATPALAGAELVASVPALKNICELEVVEFGNITSSHMSPDRMLDLAEKVEKALAEKNAAGVVITHGTDTLEETAYFIDLFLAPDKPVCLTGAMRTNSDLSPDGPDNLYCAVLAAAFPRLRGHGAVVVMNREIHAAESVTKMHKSAVQAFASPGWGPLGQIFDHEIILNREPVVRHPLRPKAPLPNVPLLKMYTGMDSRLFDALLDTGPDGLVLEGFGLGNIPHTAMPGLKKALKAGIPVVVGSRVPEGSTQGVYAVTGGARHLLSLGVMLSGGLNCQKARIKLMLALGLTRDLEALAGYFSTEGQE